MIEGQKSWILECRFSRAAFASGGSFARIEQRLQRSYNVVVLLRDIAQLVGIVFPVEEEKWEIWGAAMVRALRIRIETANEFVAAIIDHPPVHKAGSNNLPGPGVYLLSDRVNISGDEPSMPHSKDRFLNLQGQSQAGVVLKLKDRSPGFDNPEQPKTFISLYEGKSTGDMMHAYVRNITVEIGAGNLFWAFVGGLHGLVYRGGSRTARVGNRVPAHPGSRRSSMNAANLPKHLQWFFTDRLLEQQGASPHTIASYRDTFRLLLRFACKYHHRQASDLNVQDLDAKLVGSFLNHLEHDRGNSARSRNNRLSAIHSFFAA